MAERSTSTTPRRLENKGDPVRLAIEALRALNLPRLDRRDLFAAKDGLPEEDKKALAAYFSQFAKPAEGGGCVCCGQRQGASNVLGAFLGEGKFVWGIAHGEGHCSTCGYPARA